MYVALHDTAGILTWDARSFSSGNDMRATYHYLRDMTYPNQKGTNLKSPMIAKYNLGNNNGEAAAVWQTRLNTTDGKTMIAAMEHVPSTLLRNHDNDVLVVAGSTTGHGEVIGARQQSAGDWDGFFTIVDAANGSVHGEQMGTYHTHSKRIKTQLGKDDSVMGLCMDGDKAEEEAARRRGSGETKG